MAGDRGWAGGAEAPYMLTLTDYGHFASHGRPCGHYQHSLIRDPVLEQGDEARAVPAARGLPVSAAACSRDWRPTWRREGRERMFADLPVLHIRMAFAFCFASHTSCRALSGSGSGIQWRDRGVDKEHRGGAGSGIGELGHRVLRRKPACLPTRCSALPSYTLGAAPDRGISEADTGN